MHQPTELVKSHRTQDQGSGEREVRIETVDGLNEMKRAAHWNDGREPAPIALLEKSGGRGEVGIRNQRQILEELKARADRHYYEKLK